MTSKAYVLLGAEVSSADYPRRTIPHIGSLPRPSSSEMLRCCRRGVRGEKEATGNETRLCTVGDPQMLFKARLLVRFV